MMLRWKRKQRSKAKSDTHWKMKPSPWGFASKEEFKLQVSPLRSSEFHRLVVPNLTPIVKMDRNASPLSHFEPIPVVTQGHSLQKRVFPVDGSITMILRTKSGTISTPQAPGHDVTISDQDVLTLTERKKEKSLISRGQQLSLLPAKQSLQNVTVGMRTSEEPPVNSRPWGMASLTTPSKLNAWRSPTPTTVNKRPNPEERAPLQTKRLCVGDGGRQETLVRLGAGGAMIVVDTKVPRSSPTGLNNILEPQGPKETKKNEFASLQGPSPGKLEHPFLNSVREKKRKGAAGTVVSAQSTAEAVGRTDANEQSGILGSGEQTELWKFMEKSADLGFVLQETGKFNLSSVEDPSRNFKSAGPKPVSAVAQKAVASPNKDLQLREKTHVAASKTDTVDVDQGAAKEKAKNSAEDAKVNREVPNHDDKLLKLSPIPKQQKRGGRNRSNSRVDQTRALASGERACSCKKSKCLKLYCECFASSMLCNPNLCICNDCRNTTLEDEERVKSVKKVLKRNREAFSVKRPNRKERRAALLLQPKSARVGKGCKCGNTHCLKKYCECFFTNSGCSDLCKCTDCRNPFKKSLSTKKKKCAAQSSLVEK